MSNHTRFGPSGVPPMFRLMGAKLADVPKLLKEEDLNAFEYAAVRWGQIPQIKREDAEKFSVEAKKNDISISVHASYFINLFGEPQVVEASKQRITACAIAAKWMNAKVVVFHPGFYGKNSKKETLTKAVSTIKEVVKSLKTMGIDEVKLGPETMGRHSQFGTLDELLTLCQEVEQTQMVIDWSHLHARTGGSLRTSQDFREILTKTEAKLGTDAIKNMHCHFSKIEYSYKSGERRHHSLDEKAYGPEFVNLAEVVAEFNLHPTIICETPLLDIDAMKMRNTLKSILEKQDDI